MAVGELLAGECTVAAKEGNDAQEREEFPAVNGQQGPLESVGPGVSNIQAEIFQGNSYSVPLLKVGGGRVNKHTRFYSDDSDFSDFSDSLEDIHANHELRLLHNKRRKQKHRSGKENAFI